MNEAASARNTHMSLARVWGVAIHAALAANVAASIGGIRKTTWASAMVASVATQKRRYRKVTVSNGRPTHATGVSQLRWSSDSRPGVLIGVPTQAMHGTPALGIGSVAPRCPTTF